MRLDGSSPAAATQHCTDHEDGDTRLGILADVRLQCALWLAEKGARRAVETEEIKPRMCCRGKVDVVRPRPRDWLAWGRCHQLVLLAVLYLGSRY